MASQPALKISDVVKETLLGGSEETSHLSARTKTRFIKNAVKDPDTGELYMGPGEFLEMIAPVGRDYVSFSSFYRQTFLSSPPPFPRLSFLLRGINTAGHIYIHIFLSGWCCAWSRVGGPTPLVSCPGYHLLLAHDVAEIPHILWIHFLCERTGGALMRLPMPPTH